MKKYFHINIFKEIHRCEGLFSAVVSMRGYILPKWESIPDTFCEICEVLQNTIYKKNCWEIASEFQQQFRRITLFTISTQLFTGNRYSQSIQSICTENI